MRVKLCAGIGDTLWVLQKLLSTGGRFDFLLASDPPQRGHRIFELFPGLTSSVEYGSFGSLWVVGQPQPATWAEVAGRDEVTLCVNSHLESGRHLDTYLPDLPTVYEPAYATSQWEREAEECLAGKTGPIVGIYASAYEPARAWGFWEVEPWKVLARLCMPATFVIFGASFDVPLSGTLAEDLRQEAPVVRVIGRPLGLVVELFRRLDYFFCFPSGLGPLAVSVGCPTLMFYPPHLDGMRGTWAPPGAVASRRLIEPLFQMTPGWAVSIAREAGYMKTGKGNGP